MKQYIDKSALVAEIEKRIKEHHSGYLVCLKDILSFLDTLEVKEEPVSKEYWLFTINFDNVILNCFFDWFPSKKDLKIASKGKEYAIINALQLTKEQFNKLTKDE